MYSLPSLKPACCLMSGSNCCFLTYIQVSQEAGKVVWLSHLFKNFPQFVVIYTVTEPEIKLPASIVSQRKQGNSRKTTTSASLAMLKPLIVWITTNREILKEMGITDHLTRLLRNLYAAVRSIKKQLLELYMEQQTGSKSGREYMKAARIYTLILLHSQK